MPRTLFATLGIGADFCVRRIPLDAATQNTVTQNFETQETTFLDGKDDEHLFEGDYSPDPNELMYVDDLPEAARIVGALEGNALAVDTLTDAELSSGRVRSLFTGYSADGTTFASIQNFQRSQVLTQGRSLFKSNDTYTAITQTGLTIGPAVSCVVVNERMKFEHLTKAKRIFDLSAIVREATEPEVRQFAAHASLSIGNLDEFVAQTDQTLRKKIYQIGRSGILDQHPVAHIEQAATALGMDLTVKDDRIELPATKREMKKVIQFLDDGIYRSGLTDTLYYTNSKRRLNP